MGLLSFYSPADRHNCAEALMEQGRFARCPSPCAVPVPVGGGPCFSRQETARVGFGSRSLVASPFKEQLRDRTVMGQRSPHEQRHLPPSSFQSWRFAGKAGSRDYFSIPRSDASWGSLMQSASRREEKRELQRLERELKAERL
ncbi:hypothetical protein TcCL_NonESM08553 [Trypanosoma cruzi]|nr:hypothetical protein TcCL_NonESM08553 [Trypanosoma cruzi]